MTDELGSSARALLDAARQGLAPDAAAIERVRAKVDVAVAAGATGAAGAATGVTLAGKLGILAVVAAIATGGYLYATRDREPSTAARRLVTGPTGATAATDPARATAATGPARATDRPLPPPPAPSSIRASETPPAPDEPLGPATRSDQRAAAPAARVGDKRAAPREIILAPQPTAPGRKGIDLAREVELVDRAMAALRRGSPREALAAVRAHATETAGAGQLAEDAAAIEIEALCKLGHASVPGKLATFEQRWPESAQRSRLTTRCP